MSLDERSQLLIVMLGCTSTSTTFNDLWRFDLDRARWVRPLATGATLRLQSVFSHMCYIQHVLLEFWFTVST